MKKMMSTAHLFFFIICVLFLRFTAAQTLVDTSGNPFRCRLPYYISSVGRGAAGGDLSLVTSRSTCPLDVIQMPSDIRPGLPLTFHPASGRDGPINARANQKFQFTTTPVECNESTVVTVRIDPFLRRSTLSTGGVLGNPTGQDPAYWFKFEPYEPSGPNTWYRLQYCLSCERCRMADQCSNVTIVSYGRSRRLALATTDSDAPFTVNIRRARAYDKSAE